MCLKSEFYVKISLQTRNFWETISLNTKEKGDNTHKIIKTLTLAPKLGHTHNTQKCLPRRVAVVMLSYEL